MPGMPDQICARNLPGSPSEPRLTFRTCSTEVSKDFTLRSKVGAAAPVLMTMTPLLCSGKSNSRQQPSPICRNPGAEGVGGETDKDLKLGGTDVIRCDEFKGCPALGKKESDTCSEPLTGREDVVDSTKPKKNNTKYCIVHDGGVGLSPHCHTP